MNNNADQSHVLNAPFEAYEGNEPYIFISYKHDDWKIVYPVIKKLHDAGFNIWYDANLEKGKYYDIQIANHIKKSDLFVTFITQTVIDCSIDEDDYLIKELTVANMTKRKRLPIFLDNVELDGFYLMHYLGKQSILKHEYGKNDDMFIEACISTFKNFGLEPKEIQSSNNDSVVLEDLSPAYEGDEPYIFLSYSRFDTSRIYPEIKQFQEEGYNLWYDECGIGRSSSETIYKSILHSSLFVVYISNNSVESSNIKGEIELASSQGIPILPVYLEETELTDNLKRMLTNIQSILKYRINEEEYNNRIKEYFKYYGF